MKVRVQPPRVNAPGKNKRDLLVQWIEAMGNRHGVPSEVCWLDGMQLWAHFALDAVTRERAAESAADLITWKAQNANMNERASAAPTGRSASEPGQPRS
jgi:hypothetical protein